MVTRRLHLQQVAATLQADMELLRALNPQYRRDIIPGNINPYMLQLPHSLACAFVEKEDSIYAHKVAGQPPTVSGRY
jgi:membrane-bound lytic murein transglycosylase D